MSLSRVRVLVRLPNTLLYADGNRRHANRSVRHVQAVIQGSRSRTEAINDAGRARGGNIYCLQPRSLASVAPGGAKPPGALGKPADTSALGHFIQVLGSIMQRALGASFDWRMHLGSRTVCTPFRNVRPPTFRRRAGGKISRCAQNVQKRGVPRLPGPRQLCSEHFLFIHA